MNILKSVEQKNCGTCVFCAQSKSGQNECRRKSPVPLPMQRQGAISGQMEMTIGTIWPPVVLELWCGEYSPANLLN